MNNNKHSNEQILKPVLLLTSLTVALLAPFLNKAFHIDDTMFLQAARQIAENPFDFYGSTFNWYGCNVRMSEVNQNPPLVSYLIAAISSLFGWSEIALHTAFLLPAVAATLGTWLLARFFCPHPILAALIMLVSPSFLVSSTNVMSDTTMLALFIWGLACWMQGLESGRWVPCLISVLLISAATMTKYFAITAVPLIALLTLTLIRRPDPRLVLLFIPIATLLGFDKLTETLYDHGLFVSAANLVISSQQMTMSIYIQKFVIGLSFTGGCLAVYFFFVPFLFTRIQVLAGGVGLAIIAVLITLFCRTGLFSLIDHNKHLSYALITQLSLFILTGLAVLGQGARDLIHHRDGKSLFLFCWITGTFVFTSFNWTINARYILPIAPCIAILIVRQLANTCLPAGRLFWPLLPAVLLSLSVAWADTSLANIQKSASRQIADEFASWPGTVWFQGHWGFQQYMEEAGYKPLDFDHCRMQPGDLMILPMNNANTRYPPPGFEIVKVIQKNTPGFFGTMERTNLRAGFYTSVWGPLPFSIGQAPAEEFYVFSVGKDFMIPPAK